MAASKSAPFGQVSVSGFSIKGHGVEDVQILQRSEQNAFQHGTEVNPLLRTVFKQDIQDVLSGDLKPGDEMDGLAHGLSEWFDLDRRLTGLQQIPIAQTASRLRRPV